ncbi:MAG: LysR substrate-binding domain-containing protein, partial [Actinomycetota bacterium]|nr:LysR substrate-binding domain-containing protein [Actinomycetota bacterium]
LGQLDVGIVSPRPTIPGLVWRRLLRQRLRLAVPTTHRLASRDTVLLETLADEAFLSMSAGFGMRTILEGLCAAAGFVPQIAVECQELTTVAALVGAGLGIAVLPVEEVPLLPAGVSLVNIADADAVRDIGMVWQPHPTGQIRDFVDRARAVTASVHQRVLAAD